MRMPRPQYDIWAYTSPNDVSGSKEDESRRMDAGHIWSWRNHESSGCKIRTWLTTWQYHDVRMKIREVFFLFVMMFYATTKTQGAKALTSYEQYDSRRSLPILVWRAIYQNGSTRCRIMTLGPPYDEFHIWKATTIPYDHIWKLWPNLVRTLFSLKINIHDHIWKSTKQPMTIYGNHDQIW